MICCSVSYESDFSMLGNFWIKNFFSKMWDKTWYYNEQECKPANAT